MTEMKAEGDTGFGKRQTRNLICREGIHLDKGERKLVAEADQGILEMSKRSQDRT
jgi:hypothetical protein